MKYINKKEQAPSYCDRCLFKPNMPCNVRYNFYRCLHEMHGSDHRPVQLGLTLENFGQPQFQELHRLLDMESPRQGYGELKISMVSISEFNFNKSSALYKFVNPLFTASAEATHKLHFRVSFYDYAMDKISCPINFSEQNEILMSPGPGQV